MKIDINCDMGENMGNDEDIMPYITSANIACGFHAGDANSMRATVLLAKQYDVFVGAKGSIILRIAQHLPTNGLQFWCARAN